MFICAHYDCAPGLVQSGTPFSLQVSWNVQCTEWGVSCHGGTIEDKWKYKVIGYSQFSGDDHFDVERIWTKLFYLRVCDTLNALPDKVVTCLSLDISESKLSRHFVEKWHLIRHFHICTNAVENVMGLVSARHSPWPKPTNVHTSAHSPSGRHITTIQFRSYQSQFRGRNGIGEYTRLFRRTT